MRCRRDGTRAGENVKVAVWYGGKDIRIEDTSKPRAGPSESVIRVKAVGICGSDLHSFESLSKRRIPPLVMGHEFAGIVEEIGRESPDNIAVGDRVVVNPVIHCGICEECLSGRTNICRARRHLGVDLPGGFAEYVRVPSNLCYRISPSTSFEEAALTEPLSVGTHATSVANLKHGDIVLILGSGIIGLSCLIAAREKAKMIVVSDMFDFRLNFARLFGADATIDAGATDTVEEVQRITSGRGVDVAIEAVGVEQTVRQAVSSVKRGGEVTIVGNLEENVRLNIPQITGREIQVNGCYGRTNRDFRDTLKLLERDRSSIGRLVTHTFPLDRISDAFETSSTQKNNAMKVLVLP
jgi:L-iditol 2-dehydrogenase